MERWGKPSAAGDILKPGLHLKMPWPIDKVYRFQTDKIQSFRVGMAADEDHGKVITWNVKHEDEPLNLMVASREGRAAGDINVTGGVPIDLLTVGIPVQYQISDVRAYAYNHLDSGALLERIAMREVVRLPGRRRFVRHPLEGQSESFGGFAGRRFRKRRITGSLG